ncbi:MAG: LysM peptidoglycan-binding domain-containing M23 family metallopeptidase, partial [Candidatus Omnitrophica bacterium]|nr:LysM peptidoglycan-binding domain-containing M23 family metallopeptidase [Candidatus Omnitrophota bacterium]
PLPAPSEAGFYHRVTEGQTLWAIAKSYNIEISKVAIANRLQDPSRIEAGQMLFIPQPEKKIETTFSGSGSFNMGFMWPVDGSVISYFGQKRNNIVNNGIDILTYKNAPVCAAHDGTVSFCDDKVKGFGKTIIIDHSGGYSTVYTHNSENLVKAGDKVKRGQLIARVGDSSRFGSHVLHFEIRKAQKPQNPFYYLP